MTVRTRSRVVRLAGGMLAAVVLWAGLAIACGPFLTFRVYLRRSFWQPVHHMAESLASTAPRGGGTAPYAGFAEDAAPRTLADLREAYRGIASGSADEKYTAGVAAARKAAGAALADSALGGAALSEARFLDAKVAMRAADAEMGSLDEARRKLEAFLATRPAPAAGSEARCWLAHVLNRQGDAVGAVHIYLEELARPPQVVPAEVLATSVRIAFVDHEQQFFDKAETFFDTPAHALFIVNLLTNPETQWAQPAPNATKARNGARILALLRKRRALFAEGPDSDALRLALMRASLYSGDPAGALADSKAIAGSSALRGNPEFNWMVASASFLAGDFAAAETPLQRMLGAPGATAADRRIAAQALVGVYLKTGRRVEALHAAFVHASTDSESEGFERSSWPQWCWFCDSLDLPYLLDAALSKAQLSEYLRTFPEPVGAPLAVSGGRKMSAPDIVSYSLAVREARDGRYGEAAAIYSRLGATARAGRTGKLAAFSTRAADSSLPAADRLQARFDLAAFLADNPDRILFNDLLWEGFQRMALLPGMRPWDAPPDRESGMTAEEHDAALARDRRLRDAQEERWQAFLQLEKVAQEAGHSANGRQAASKILDCLTRINTDRFGREAEIAAATRKWTRWLRAPIS